MTTIKNIIPFAGDGDQVTLKGTETLAPGRFVKIAAAGISLADAGEAYIGQVEYDDRELAVLEAATYAANAMVPVRLINKAKRCVAGDAVAVGNYVLLTSDGKIDAEAVVTTRTANTVGVALTAAAADGDIIDIVPL